MSLQHAILTALLERPSSGLELTRRFDRSIGFFWSATHQQIYRELGKLEQAGLIRPLPQQPSRGQRKEYEVLPAGQAELIGWIAEDQDPKPHRDALLLRLRAAAAVGGDSVHGLEAEFRRHLELHRQQLAEYREIERRDFGGDRPDARARLHHLVLEAGIGLETHWIDWLTRAAAELSGPDD
ncbi:PadR family transcriptional regulator [Streptacidiphilus sp. PB12-B1b]|uniref:PadR family transcriptional regulator n=1 Tax=Streptacidiphilus sp. PB12-B1b TaxID=2705012 RepID=UPI0015FE26A8|nr:PadR family transcriptional regulator [Streptacidiphilus sp. PB12-B1b]QMU76551.1 PadR family transcriptional regulator [Streptacidiphilus sp. PB12-B1b]